MFNRVESMFVADCESFEHSFFKLISESFPQLKSLYIFNEKPMKKKEELTSLILFSHLMHLDVNICHADYAEEFLVNKYCHLPSLMNLGISYETLVLVTNNFTNDATRLVCSKLTSVRVKGAFVPPEHFHTYFPLL
jgi:hypothetical protein